MKALTADDFRLSGVRGVGLGSLRFGDRSPADHDAALALGVGHVRVFLEAERDPDGDAFRFPAAQLTALDSMLASLDQRRVYLLLAAGFPADEKAALWRNSRLQASVVVLWRQLAARLKGRVVVAAFDIVNEPVPPGLNYQMRQDRWLDLAARVIEAVRQVDPSRVLVIESAPNAVPEGFDNLSPLPFANLVYSLHSYMPMAFTHQTVMTEYPDQMAYGDVDARGQSVGAQLAASLQPVLRFVQRHDVPIYVGEFSAVRWAGSAASYVRDSMALFKRYGWSWCYHEYRAWHGWDAEMAAESRSAGRRHADAPVVRELRRGLIGARNAG